jgi:hypothetical protein
MYIAMQVCNSKRLKYNHPYYKIQIKIKPISINSNNKIHQFFQYIIFSFINK